MRVVDHIICAIPVATRRACSERWREHMAVAARRASQGEPDCFLVYPGLMASSWNHASRVSGGVAVYIDGRVRSVLRSFLVAPPSRARHRSFSSRAQTVFVCACPTCGLAVCDRAGPRLGRARRHRARDGGLHAGPRSHIPHRPTLWCVCTCDCEASRNGQRAPLPLFSLRLFRRLS